MVVKDMEGVAVQQPSFTTVIYLRGQLGGSIIAVPIVMLLLIESR